MPKKSKVDDTLETLIKEGKLRKGDDPRFLIQRLPFGIPALDEIISGGLPRGRLIILSGNYASGKTFILQLALKQALEQDLTVAYLDIEKTYHPEWWNQIGIPLDKLLVMQPNTGEETIDTAAALLKSHIDVLAIDSLAALVPTPELESDAEQGFIGLQARLIGKFLRIMLALNSQSIVICTNQLRDNIGGYGPHDRMPGGRSQEFFASLILRIRREGWIEEEGRRVGFNMKVSCEKSKVGQSFRECTLPFRFRGEIDMLALMLERAIEHDLVKQTGPWYRILDMEDKVQGRNGVLEIFRKDPDMVKRLNLALGDFKEVA